MYTSHYSYCINNIFFVSQIVTTVEFRFSTLSVSESSGSLVVPLVLSGQSQSQSFNVTVIAEANNLSSFAATGKVSRVHARCKLSIATRVKCSFTMCCLFSLSL